MKYVPLGTLSVIGALGAFAASVALLTSDSENRSAATQGMSVNTPLSDPTNFGVSDTSIQSGDIVSLGATPIDGTPVSSQSNPTASGGASVLAFSTEPGAITSTAVTLTSSDSSAFDWSSTPSSSGFGLSNSASSQFIISSAAGTAASAGLATLPTNSDPFALTNTVSSNSTTSMASLIDQFSNPGTAAAPSASSASSSVSAAVLAAVPLPAGAPLLVLALGMVGYVRRKG